MRVVANVEQEQVRTSVTFSSKRCQQANGKSNCWQNSALFFSSYFSTVRFLTIPTSNIDLKSLQEGENDGAKNARFPIILPRLALKRSGLLRAILWRRKNGEMITNDIKTVLKHWLRKQQQQQSNPFLINSIARRIGNSQLTREHTHTLLWLAMLKVRTRNQKGKETKGHQWAKSKEEKNISITSNWIVKIR